MENIPRPNPAPRGKRLFAALLAAVMALGLFPSSALAGPPAPVGIDNYVATLVADPDTSAAPKNNTIPGDFGTSAADGRVWVDKSVKVASEGDSFDVTLSALAQEYIRTETSEVKVEEYADVLLVLDMSSSMNNSNPPPQKTRILSMGEAVNKAIDIIMAANPKNRVCVYSFGANGTANVTEVLPLGSYRTAAMGSGSTTNRYITATINNITRNGGLIIYDTATGLPKVPSATTTSGGPFSTSAGTSTQTGVYMGISALINGISGLSKVSYGERHPYVLLFTDGGANYVYPNWYADLTSGTARGTAVSGVPTTGNAEAAALTILTAAKRKAELTAAYASYNANPAKPEETVWFNVGLLDDDTVSQAPLTPNDNVVTALLNPGLLNPSSFTNQTNWDNHPNWKGVYDQINTKTTMGGGAAYTGTYGVSGNPGFNFVTSYIYYATDSFPAPLNKAFTDLGELVKKNTTSVTIPVVTDSSTSGEAANGVVFTDALGEHMVLNASALKLGGTSAVKDAGKSTATTAFYTFSPKTSTVTYDNTTRTLTWNLSAEDLKSALVQFADSINPASGSYKTLPAPLTLTYNVSVAEGYSSSGALYSNDGASVAFTPVADNPYYYDITYYTAADAGLEHAEGEFKSSTIKADPSPVLKTADLTGTGTNTQSYAWDTDNTLITTLGNNGKLTPMLSITKSASPDSAFTGELNVTVTYTIIVRNFTDAAVYDVVVGDTLPAALALISNSLTVNDESAAFDSYAPTSFTYTIASIGAGKSVTLTYDAALSIAVSGTYTNKATVKSVSLTEHGTQQPVTPEADTEISVVVGEACTATVDVTLDGEFYTGRTVELYQGQTLKYALGDDKDGVYTYVAVLEGTYDIYVDGIKTGITLAVSAQGKNKAWVGFYTVTFYDGVAKYDDPAPQIVLSGGKATRPSNPTKSGYTFVKWLDADGNEFAFDTAITGITNIYASWAEATSNDYTITATADSGGDITNRGSIKVAPGGGGTYTITPAAGYRVKDVLVDGVSVGPVTSYTFSNVNADHTIHVVFEPIRNVVDTPDVTVTFDSRGGTPVSPVTTAPRSRISPPVPPTRPGYVFTGWYKDPACTTLWDFTQRVNYSITLYAGWIASAAVTVPKTGGSDAWFGFAMAASALLLAGAMPLAARKRKKEQ